MTDIPAPPKAPDQRGSLALGVVLAWAALIGGYIVIAGLLASMVNIVGGGGSDGLFILCGLAPWLLILGLIVWFRGQGKTQTAKGVAIGLASIVAIFVLLAAACFTLLSNTSFH
jgi:hypothetical protein